MNKMKSDIFKIKNIIFIIRNLIRWEPAGAVTIAVRIPILVLLPIISARITERATAIITGEVSGSNVFEALVISFAILALLKAGYGFLEKQFEFIQYNLGCHYAIEMSDILMNVNYPILESLKFRNLYARCKKFGLEGQDSDGVWAIVRLSGCFTCIAGIIVNTILLSKLHISIFMVIALTCILEFVYAKKILAVGDETVRQMTDQELLFYYFYKLSADAEAAGEIRLNHAQKWLMSYVSTACEKYIAILHRYTKSAGHLSAVQAFFVMIRDAFIVLVLAAALGKGRIFIAEFVFYFQIMSVFSDYVEDIAGHLSSLHRIGVETDYYQEFLSYKNADADKTATEDKLNCIESIEFKHVSFFYEDCEKPVLKDINFSFHKRDKVAVVGPNGAGKTTLMKLLCGLYKPCSGEILYNGKNSCEIDRQVLFRNISAVMQDSFFLPDTVERNIFPEQGKGFDCSVMELVGLDDSFRKKQAAECSGGEKQKVLLARSLQNPGSLLVLDEPISAMDPVSEEHVYTKYNEFAKDKISFFVTHRLNSTRFCNAILFLQEGQIVEQGTHEELMSKNGYYRELYDIQGYYYKEGSSY